MTTSTKGEELLRVSSAVLNDLDLGEVKLEQIAAKCKMLARLTDNQPALKWFMLELHGYDNKSLPIGITIKDADMAATTAGRFYTKKDGKKYYWTASITDLETSIETDVIALQNTKPPQEYTPAITKWHETTFLAESYASVLTNVTNRQYMLSQNIKRNRVYLAKIRSSFYNFVLNINYQYKFENITESIFQQTKTNVDEVLAATIPEAFQKFIAAYNRLTSTESEEWSQALSSCRNILTDFANVVYTAQKDKFTRGNGDLLAVTEEKYKNRIIAWLDVQHQNNARNLAEARLNDIVGRLQNLHDLLSQGTKNKISKNTVNMCVIETYFLLATLLEFKELRIAPKKTN